MLVLGGTGRLYGGLVGAAVFMIAQDYLSGIDPVYWQFWIGFLLVVIVLFAHGGILGGLRSRCAARMRAPELHDCGAAHQGLSQALGRVQGEPRRLARRSRRARGTR